MFTRARGSGSRLLGAAVAAMAGMVAMWALNKAVLADSHEQTDPPPEIVTELEETKKPSSAQEGVSFIPPPRTIKDITAILDQQKLTEPGVAEEKVEMADARPPKGGSPGQLAKFYHKRGDAARRIGRSGQALEDLRKAAKHMEASGLGRKKRRLILMHLAFSEFDSGNPLDGLRYMERSIKEQPTWGAYRGLIGMYGRVGKLKSA